MMTNDFVVSISIYYPSWCYLAHTPTSILKVGWKTVCHVRLAATAPYRSYCSSWLHCLFLGIHWFLMVLEKQEMLYIYCII